MDSVMKAVEDFEKIIYKILLWFILIPKTIIKIIINPSWATKYVSDELQQTGDKRFDEYMSPLLLFLLVILIPILGISFAPNVGMNIISPTEGEINCSTTVPEDGNFSCFDYVEEGQPTLRIIPLEVESTFISNTMNLFHEFNWIIKSCPTQTSEDCTFLDGVSHNESKGTAFFTSDSNLDSYDDIRPEELQIIDNHTVRDDYYFFADQPGFYEVQIYSGNFYGDDPENQIENGEVNLMLSRTIYITVSPQSDENGQTLTDDNGNPLLDSKVQVFYDSANIVKKTPEKPETTIKSPKFIFLGLGLLLLPLLFSIATNTSKSSDISEYLLRESFYIQCYYFVPVGLVFWATYYSFIFYTSDMSDSWALLVALIVLLTIPWFFVTEVNAIYESRKFRKKWIAFGVLILCLLVVIVLGVFLLLLIADVDFLRKTILWAFPIFGMSLILFLVVRRFWKRRSKTEVSPAEPAT
jgi:hypothetical protein